MFGFLMGTLQKFKEKEEAVKGLEKVRQMLCIRNLSAVINSIIAHGLHLISVQHSLPLLFLFLHTPDKASP